MQFPAFSGSELVNWEGIIKMLTKIPVGYLAIIILLSVCSCSLLTLSINEIIFLGVNYWMLHVKQPDMVSGVALHLKWQFIYIMCKTILMFLKSQHRLVIKLNSNFMSNILPIQHDSCSEISWLFPNLKEFFSPCHSLTCGNDVLTERKVLLANTLQLTRGSQNRDFKVAEHSFAGGQRPLAWRPVF